MTTKSSSPEVKEMVITLRMVYGLRCVLLFVVHKTTATHSELFFK